MSKQKLNPRDEVTGDKTLHIEFHWILVVIDAHVDKLYVLDPLHNKIHYAEWIDIIEMAMEIFKHSIGRRGTKFDWEVVKFNPQMYHRSEIDEVRKDWGDFVQTYLD